MSEHWLTKRIRIAAECAEKRDARRKSKPANPIETLRIGGKTVFCRKGEDGKVEVLEKDGNHDNQT